MIQRIVFLNIILFVLTGCGSGGTSCNTLDCKTSTYNLLMADVDFTDANPTASNIKVVASNSYQDLTHPRVSPDKQWVAYTTYNDTNTEGCASLDSGYINTEIRATKLDESQSKTILAKTDGNLTSNSYWYGNSYEFTYLSGLPGATKIYRAQTDAAMNLISGSTEITVPATLIPPYDPAGLSNSQIVYAGLYNSGGLVASIFIQSLDPTDTPVGLSLARDNSGATLFFTVPGENNENDPKLSPDGTQVAFMRRASNSGIHSFGWRIFVVPVSSPLGEVNISSSLGSTLLLNDTLPEWVDSNTLVFSFIDVTVAPSTRTIWTMQSDGSGRKQVSLPNGFRYSDVYPFIDGSGNQKIIISAEKIDASCIP